MGSVQEKASLQSKGSIRGDLIFRLSSKDDDNGSPNQAKIRGHINEDIEGSDEGCRRKRSLQW